MPRIRIGMPIDFQNRDADNGGVTTQDAIKHFGTQLGVANALGMAQSSVAEWGKFPPKLRQIQLEHVTRRELRAETDCLPKKKAA